MCLVPLPNPGKASGSVQLQLGLQTPGCPSTLAEAGGQQGCPSPGQVSLQCSIPLPSHPSFPALLQAGTHERGAEVGKAGGNAALNWENPLAEGGRGAAGMLCWPWPPLPGERGLHVQPQQRQRQEESTNPEKMELCFA